MGPSLTRYNFSNPNQVVGTIKLTKYRMWLQKNSFWTIFKYWNFRSSLAIVRRFISIFIHNQTEFMGYFIYMQNMFHKTSLINQEFPDTASFRKYFPEFVALNPLSPGVLDPGNYPGGVLRTHSCLFWAFLCPIVSILNHI